MVNAEKLCDVIIGIIIPPVLVYMKKKCNTEFWISLILYILFFFYPASVIYSFHVCGYTDLCMNILCFFIPPIAAYLKFKCKGEFWISLVLWFFFFLPSMIYTYYLTWWLNNFIWNKFAFIESFFEIIQNFTVKINKKLYSIKFFS